MLATKKSNKLSIDQLQTILNNDHIRQHLIQVGYIDQRGDIIRKDEDNHHSKRPDTSNIRGSYPSFTRYELITSSRRRPMENKPNSGRQMRSRSPDYNSNIRRLKSASTVQSKETNKSHTSTRFSLLNQSTCIQNILLRRAVSPKILPAADRCLVTLTYFGPGLNIEYDHDLFQPEGDEILVMQQHCGGENYLVFKGFLHPDDIFSFQSRRHTDYPFALALYINGVIKDRLSVCCEFRCKNSMRIGGKCCIFAIKKIENTRACRRCRFEQRMKKLIEAETKSSTAADRDHHLESNKTRTSRSKSPTTGTKNSESTSAQSTNSKTNTALNSSPEKKGADKSSSESTIPLRIKSKQTAARTSSSESIGSDISSPKPTLGGTKSSKTNVARNSNPEPTVPYTKNSKINGARSSSPQQVESDTSSPEPTAPRTKSAKINAVRLSSPQQVESETSSPEPIAPRVKSTKINAARSSSPQQVESDTSSPEPSVPRTINSKPLVVRTSNPEERHESSPSTRIRPTTLTNHQRKAANSPILYAPDFEEPKKKSHSSISTPHENKPAEVSSSDSSESRPKNQPRILIGSTRKESDFELATTTDESNTDFGRFFVATHRRDNTDD